MLHDGWEALSVTAYHSRCGRDFRIKTNLHVVSLIHTVGLKRSLDIFLLCYCGSLAIFNNSGIRVNNIHYPQKVMNIWLLGWNFRINLKCIITFTGELNVTFWGNFSFHSRRVHAQDGWLNQREVSIQSVSFLSWPTFFIGSIWIGLISEFNQFDLIGLWLYCNIMDCNWLELDCILTDLPPCK